METVEIYYDPSGFKGSKHGCYKARLARKHSIWDSGVTIAEAILEFIKTAISFGKSDRLSHYRFKLIDKRCDNPSGIKEIADLLLPFRSAI